MFSVKKWLDRWKGEQRTQLLKELEEELESARRARGNALEQGAVVGKKSGKRGKFVLLALTVLLDGLLVGLYVAFPSTAMAWVVGGAVAGISGLAFWIDKRRDDQWKHEQVAQLVDELERERRVRELRP